MYGLQTSLQDDKNGFHIDIMIDGMKWIDCLSSDDNKRIFLHSVFKLEFVISLVQVVGIQEKILWCIYAIETCAYCRKVLPLPLLPYHVCCIYLVITVNLWLQYSGGITLKCRFSVHATCYKMVIMTKKSKHTKLYISRIRLGHHSFWLRVPRRHLHHILVLFGHIVIQFLRIDQKSALLDSFIRHSQMGGKVLVVTGYGICVRSRPDPPTSLERVVQ